MNNWYEKSDLEVVRELAAQLRISRLKRNLSQQELADKAGLDRTTITQLENGRPATILTLVQVLRALDKLEILAAFEEAPQMSPLQAVKLMEKARKKASPRRKRDWKGKDGW